VITNKCFWDGITNQ